jgi:hypothetical protein
MIHEVAGDMLLSEAAAVTHGVAPNENFANGLALSLRERWPGMYKDFRHLWPDFHTKGRRVMELGGCRECPDCQPLHSGSSTESWGPNREMLLLKM